MLPSIVYRIVAPEVEVLSVMDGDELYVPAPGLMEGVATGTAECRGGSRRGAACEPSGGGTYGVQRGIDTRAAGSGCLTERLV